MVPMWFVPIAIACGNAVVLKPSEKDPSAAHRRSPRCGRRPACPTASCNVVNGDKEAVDALLTHPDVKSVSFVGSTPIAKYVYETGTAHGKRVQALGGAKNHMLVLPDADLDLAADAAVNAGFGSAGERCMAISALRRRRADRRRAGRRRSRTGWASSSPATAPAAATWARSSPAQHRDKVTVATSTPGVEAGATLVVDGRERRLRRRRRRATSSRPTLFDNVDPGHVDLRTTRSSARCCRSCGCTSYDEGLELINANPYGNGTAIFTNDGGAARRFQNEVEVGMVGVNVPIPVPVAYYSFGGWKNSLFGDTHAHGMEGVHFFTRGKVVTSRWLDPSHGGLNLGFPQNV